MRGRTNLAWHLLIIFGYLGFDGKNSSIRELTALFYTSPLEILNPTIKNLFIIIIILYDMLSRILPILIKVF